jgi:hypothetical protein
MRSARPSRDSATRAPPEVKSYLAVCAIYRDEATYFPEWLEFHRLVGVEQFYLYDNGSTDDSLDVLAPYLDAGIVTRHTWPRYPGQYEAYEHCAAVHAGEARWIAFIDLDEFLFSPAGTSLTDSLRDYESHVAVAVNWAVYGSGGHETKPEGLTIENFLWRVRDGGDPNRLVKAIADPSQVTRCRNPHYFFYKDGQHAVDEKLRPVPYARTEDTAFERLRINHYFTRSDEEFLRKLQKGRLAWQLAGYRRAMRRYREMGAERSEVRDEAILPYVPRLREALAGAPARPRARS